MFAKQVFTAFGTVAGFAGLIVAGTMIGSPSIRVHVPKGKSPDDISCAVEALKAIAGYGAEKNIVINLV